MAWAMGGPGRHSVTCFIRTSLQHRSHRSTLLARARGSALPLRPTLSIAGPD